MRRACFLWIPLSVAFLISACAGPSRVEKDFGTSVKFARSDQILDQGAGKNLEPVTGFDGKAAEISIERYRKSFEEVPRAPQYIYQLEGKGSR